jgi:hypothetical protein
MDPLMLIIDDMERLRLSCDQMESEITLMETNLTTSDPRYGRLQREKEMLMANLCTIRHDLCAKGTDMGKWVCSHVYV